MAASSCKKIETTRDIFGGRDSLALLIPSLILFTSFFSPLLGYSLALFVLIIRTHEMQPLERKLLGYCIAFAGAVIVSSRATGDISDDLTIHYYPIYLEMTSGDFSSFFSWGWGIEIGINVINAIMVAVLPKLTESGYAFMLAFMSGTIFVIIVEKYLLQECTEIKKGVSSAVIYAMYSAFFATQLSRQFLAGLFLIVALFENRKPVGYLALLVSSVFHLSSLPLYGFYRAAGWFRLNRLYLFIPIAIGAYFLINWMAPLLELVSSVLPDTRLLFYAKESGLESNLFPFKYLLVVLPAVVMMFVIRIKQRTEREKSWISIYIIVVTFYFMTLDLLLFPTRAFLLIHGMLLGWFFVMMYRHLPVLSCMVISFLVVAFYIQGKMFVDEKVINALWNQFDRISFIPGYYMLHYFN
jgi:hypothetical protein